jgi:energy-coupling factor transporter ATP-binding protein EcfA2
MIAGTVEDEISFGPMNLGLAADEVGAGGRGSDAMIQGLRAARAPVLSGAKKSA